MDKFMNELSNDLISSLIHECFNELVDKPL